jgi:uncharacterized protein
MSDDIGCAAIERAVRSIESGGLLELVFFGGEPLLEAARIAMLAEFAAEQCRERHLQLKMQLTTNGTIDTTEAWKILTSPDIRIHISHDGVPEIHDRHRRRPGGENTSDAVLATIERLLAVRGDLGVVMVVRPDGVESLCEGIRFLRERGVRRIEPSLDLWAAWNSDDAARLEAEIGRCADLWLEGLPHSSIGWFDEKAVQMLGMPNETKRCRFGDGELAVSPAGNLYPCERLIGDDSPDHPLRLPGHVLEGADFQPYYADGRSDDFCGGCDIRSQCNTICRCANYVRTGDIRRPDGLLCLLDRTCHRETARVLGKLPIMETGNTQSACIRP